MLEILFFFVLPVMCAEKQPLRTVRARAGVESAGGEPPYEIVWAGRKEPADTLFRFNDMKGWSLELGPGCEAELRSTTEQVLWSAGDPTARLTYRSTGPKLQLVIRPPAPIPIPKEARGCEFWCYGNNWGWRPDPSTPQLDISLLVEGPVGEIRKEFLTRVRWKEWFLVHKRFTREGALGAVSLRGIEISGPPNKSKRSLFFESFRFTKEELKPLSFPPRPKRNLKLFPGQDPGLNTGAGKLPFPTREETILPANLTPSFTNEIRNGAEGVRFLYRGADGMLAYRIRLEESSGLPVVTASWNKSNPVEILKGAAVKLESVEGKWRLLSRSLSEATLQLKLRKGSGPEVIYRFRIMQKSLLWDVICTGGRATELTFGEAGPFERAELIPIPYVTYGLRERDPCVLLCRPKGGPFLFLSLWPDWYRSNASLPFSDPKLEPDSSGLLWASPNGGLRYIAKTDGKRNDLFERIFVTVSPAYEEVLPRIANPPSPHGREAGKRLWQETWGPSDYDREMARSRRLRSYGIRYLTQLNHEITWRDEGESFTLRLRSAPKKGGDQALKRYIAHQKSLGWLAGLYTNYTDFAPVNSNWNPDFVQRTPEGQWRTAWPRCYALKPAQAVVFDRFYAPKIKAKFRTNAAYTDVHTAAAPWHYCDFDHRVPGAGTFAQTFYLYGELLLHDQSVYGPTWSEGTYQWMYAGLATGNYGLCYTGVDLSTFPLLPVFDLREIHPRECDIGMPWTSRFLRGSEWNKPENIDAAIDHFLAATLAYGHIGWLVEERYGVRLTCRSYYMLQPVQSAYALVPVSSIEYHDPERDELVSVSRALSSGVWRKSRLAVAYQNGLRLWINGDDAVWILGDKEAQAAVKKHLGCTAILPKWGYLAVGPNLFVYSGLFGTRRVDVSLSQEVLYVDARDRPCRFPFGVTCRGAVAVRQKAAGSFEVIEGGGNRWIGLGGAAPGALPPGSPDLSQPLRIVEAKAYSAEGAYLGAAQVRNGSEVGFFAARKEAVRYEVSGTRAPAALQVTWHNALGAPVAVFEGKLNLAVSLPSGIKASAVRAVLEPWGTEVKRKAGAGPIEFSIPVGPPVEKPVWLTLYAQTPTGESALYFLLPARLKASFFPTAASFRLPDQNPSFLLEKWGETRLPLPSWLKLSGKKALSPLLSRLLLSCKEEKVPAKGDLFGFPFKKQAESEVLWDLLSRSTPRRWVVCFRGGTERSGDPATGASCYVTTRKCGGLSKRCLFTHPPYRGGVGYTAVDFGPLLLPQRPARFVTWVGIADGGDVSDGASLSVWAGPEPGKLTRLAERLVKRPGWQKLSVDLTPYRGKPLFLRLKADVGPADNSNSDWVCWGEPRIVETAPKALLKIAQRPKS